jgi:hypothetical protein
MTDKSKPSVPATASELAHVLITLLEHWNRQAKARAKVSVSAYNNAHETDLELSVEYGDFDRPSTYTSFTVRVAGPFDAEGHEC